MPGSENIIKRATSKMLTNMTEDQLNPPLSAKNQHIAQFERTGA
jgi:hypothetical protein